MAEHSASWFDKIPDPDGTTQHIRQSDEMDLRAAFENCVEIMWQRGDMVARVQTLQYGGQISAVICVVGPAHTSEVVARVDDLMENWDRAREALNPVVV